MVRLVPEFLRKIVVQKGTKANSQDATVAGDSNSVLVIGNSFDDSSQVNAAYLQKEQEITASSALDHTVVKGDLIGHGITSNIATIALGDWGYPVYEDRRQDGVFCGRYFAGLLRNYVSSSDPLESFAGVSRSKLIPKVEESDFAEYVRQISVFYAMMDGDTAKCDNSDDTQEKHVPNETQIPKEYYSETYVMEKNEVFKRELESIPEIMSSMEAQLEAVNGELQEMLERRYVHVHEACTSVEELHARFLDLTKQINRIRADLEGETARVVSTQNAQKNEITVEEEVDTILQRGIARKKDLQIILGHLQLLRAITALPEYIQGLADSHGIAVANIVGTCSIKYLYGDVGKFKLAKSMASVLNETIANLESVAETKFVNLALMALMELGNSNDMAATVGALKTTFNQMQQPLIALMNANTMRGALETLRTTANVSRKVFQYDKPEGWYDFMESFEKHKSKMLSYLFLLQVWGCMILRQILCIQRMKRRDSEMLRPDESATLIQKILSIIRETLSSTTPRGNLTTASPISLLIKKAIVLPCICDDRFDYASIFDSQSLDEVVLVDGNESDLINLNLIDEFLEYCEAVKQTIDEIAKNTFADFAREMVHLYSWKDDAEVQDYLNFIEGCKTFKANYDRLLIDISANDVFCSMLWSTLEAEWMEHNRSTTNDNWLVGIKTGLSAFAENVHGQFRKTAEQSVRRVGLSCLEALKLGNMVAVQYALGKETWDKRYTQMCKIDQEETSFTLVTSCATLDERLNLYPIFAEASPLIGESLAQDCTHLMEMFHSLLDAEVSGVEFSDFEIDQQAMRKSCLMAEALRYFSHRVMDVTTKILNNASYALTADEHSEPVASEELESKFKDLYGAAQKCSLDIESLKHRTLQMVSNYIRNQLKQRVERWISQPSSVAYHDGEVIAIIRIIQECVDTTADILKDVTDVQLIFEMAFQEVHTDLRPESLDEARKEDFRDSCAELITQLSHNTCIKLEICCLADTLSNELFS
ncbi:golgin subfamily A member 3 protein, putative [Babesia ovis]|uniref:Golgin subfamily A member 3 protein, putative n=1 Tax=Babesia ovis TaxID=5869 RepID=A0A9W5WTW6_BABOV|nr:golgin subfamily A member 3 protein, putative [Babesia ovis]